MRFQSDNTAPVHPRVLAALAEANGGHAASYGDDAWTARAEAALREAFEAPEAAVRLVATGTAANALLLSTLARPWEAIFCTGAAHVEGDECNAVGALSGGAKLVPVAHRGGRMDPAALAEAIGRHAHGDVHGTPPGVVTVTQATERGEVMAPEEVAALGAVAARRGLRLHMDGTRLANAVAALGCAPADVTWRAGVAACSWGGTKNGLMGVEAVLVFDASLARDFDYRRMRAGHLLSKSRFLAAQVLAGLAGGLWLETAGHANAMLARLLAGLRACPGVAVEGSPRANLAFVRLPTPVRDALRRAGATFHELEGGVVRLVCDWSTTEAEVDAALAVVRAASAVLGPTEAA